MDVVLGPFRLVRPIARGGMGRVWRAQHVTQGTPVAIKVLHGHAVTDQRFLESFRGEVRAVATLDHPGIVMLLDHGTVPDDQASPDNGIVAGSPWLAMELASGGTLSHLSGALSWPALKAILLALLEGLAHAHARGVVHRDLKPSNILIATPRDLRPGLKLSDFGIAHALDTERTGPQEEAIIGTPMFMAPEQIRGLWRDHGPWTDLYALGCVTWVLATGQTPFDRKRPGHAIMIDHLTQPFPEFVPVHPLPEAFGCWLDRLLRRDRFERFQNAADAAHALLQLDAGRAVESPFADALDTGPHGEAPANPGSDNDPVANAAVGATRISLGETWRMAFEPVSDSSDPAGIDTIAEHPDRQDGAGPDQSRGEDAGGEADNPADDPADHTADDPVPASALHAAPPGAPMPVSWRRTVPPAPSIQLVGAGLSLYGLRSVRLVGREAERDALWDVLQKVRQEGSARLVVLRGAAGTGKSRLARWLCERAAETGAAHVTSAHFAPELQPGFAIRDLGARYLRTHDLDRAEVEARVGDWVSAWGGSDDERRVLTELLHPSTSTKPEPGVVRLTRPSEYHAAVAGVFRRLAIDRPLITWLDDVQWGFHGLGLARHILEGQDTVPVPQLLVATVRDEALADRPDEARRLRQLLEHPRTTVISCAPLPETEHAQLIGELLPLDEAIRVQIAERTAGNPLFAVQLVGDWVQRGLLEPTPKGFRLHASTEPILPDDLHEVWSSRIERLLTDFSAITSTDADVDAPRIALEIAAALGTEVTNAEWHQTVDDPQGLFGDRFQGGRRTRQLLLDRLLTERLATPVGSSARGSDGRWAFVHSMLKEALERSAREAGRWAAHNVAAATMIMARYDVRRFAPLSLPAERLGRHLLEAGQVQTAIQPLLGGVQQRLLTMGPNAALSLLDTTTRAMLEVGLPQTDKRWARVWTLSARIHIERADYALAERFHMRVLQNAEANGWRGAELYALHGEVRRLLAQGRTKTAEQTLSTLLERATQAEKPRPQGLARLGLGRLHLQRGEADQALLELQTAIPLLASDPIEQAEARLELARARRAAGHEAVAEYELAIRTLSDLGLGRRVAVAHAELGRLLVQRGRPEAALQHLDIAATRFESLGDPIEAGEVRLQRMDAVVRAASDPGALNASLRPDLQPERIRSSLTHLPHKARIDVTVALSALDATLVDDPTGVRRAAPTLAPDTHPWVHTVRRIAARIWRLRGEDDLATRLSGP